VGLRKLGERRLTGGQQNMILEAIIASLLIWAIYLWLTP
jgi:hypothetical protein